MEITAAGPTTATAAAAPLEDLSAFVVSGRLKSHLPPDVEFETSVRTPAQGIQDGVDAEAIGFRRVFLAERAELKEPGTLLGAIGARTERLGVATGIIAAGARHPMLLASLGATMQAAFGPRFTLGLGRGAQSYGHGGHLSFEGFADVCTIVKRLWAGERFSYSGPAGDFGDMGLRDVYEGSAPEIYAGMFGLPRGARTIAETPAIDGILIPALVTPTGVAQIVENLTAACERVDRDPKSIRVLVEVVTAPELSEKETTELTSARAVTYLQPPAWGQAYPKLNGWDPAALKRLREHTQFRSVGSDPADHVFHRKDLQGPAALVPQEWMDESCAIGSIDACVSKLAEFRAAGADEITTYGSTPGQNAKLAEAWRTRAARQASRA